jgi:hypothetical protein
MEAVGDAKPHAASVVDLAKADGSDADTESSDADTESSDADTESGADGCQGLRYEDDQFCRYCGYSRKKCTACGKKLPTVAADNCGNPLSSAEKFCPSCGAGRSGQQVVRISPVSSRARVIGSIVKVAVVLVVAPIIVLLIAGFLLAQPSVSRSTAQSFFDYYFTHVENAKQRAQLYAQDLTTSFKQLAPNQPGSYNPYWDSVKSVDVGPAYPVSGNSFEFTLSVTIHYKNGRTLPVRANYWFVCTGFRGTLIGRLPWKGCPEWALKIDNGQDATLSSGSG